MRFWDPTVGCSPVSEGCKICSSAQTVARNSLSPCTVRKKAQKEHWSGVVLLQENAFNEVTEFAPYEQVFVCGRSDLFHEDIPIQYRDRIIQCAESRPDCTFLALTKRPENIHRYDYPTNFWVGVSAENQTTLDRRLPLLAGVNTTRIVSIKPMLGPIDLTGHMGCIEMVAAGGEHGRGARPMHPEWIRNLRDQCVKHQKPFSFHNWGTWMPGETKSLTLYIDNSGKFHEEASDGLVPVHFAHPEEAGWELDGKVWDQYPQ